MAVSQISVFIENQLGRLVEILEFLAEEHINLRAYSVAETSDFGVMRMIVQDTDAALTAFKVKGFTAKKTDILCVVVNDIPGATVETFRLLKRAGIEVEYTYAFSQPEANQALLLLRVSDLPRAEELLSAAGIRLAAHGDIF